MDMFWLTSIFYFRILTSVSAGHPRNCQKSDEGKLYNPDPTLIWTNITQQEIKPVWNWFPYYIVKIPTINICFGKIQIQICYIIYNHTDKMNAVTFTWYQKIKDGLLLRRKSSIRHIIEERSKNCTRHNGGYVCCPTFSANDENFERDISAYIGIYASLDDKNFKLLMLDSHGSAIETCTINRHRWKMLGSQNVNISADCNASNYTEFNPIVFRIWINKSTSNEELKLGLFIGGGIILFISIIVIVIAIIWCMSSYYKRKIHLLSRDNVTLMEEKCPVIKSGISKTNYETGFNVVNKKMDNDIEHDKEQEETQVDECNYVVPPFEEEALYSVLEMNIEYILRTSVKCHTIIGSGQFGNVYKGVWLCRNREIDVAVKTLKNGCTDEDRVKFLQEAAIMGQFKDPNVVTLYGVVIAGEPILLVLELLPNGDLLSHLKKSFTNKDGINHLDPHTFLSYCRQIVSGMVHLSSKHFVHRDLAARNILMSSQGICKIDFGMALDFLYDDHNALSWKWAAPEVFHFNRYSTASDVWSFGVVMYEIWRFGQMPSFLQIEKMIDSGYRLPPPPDCPRKIYSLMINCWHSEPENRPSFIELKEELSLSDSMLLKSKETPRYSPDGPSQEDDFKI